MMRDMQKEMTEYLKILINRYLYIDSLNKQVIQLTKWSSSLHRDAYEAGDYFFDLTKYTFGRTMLLELCKLTSRREERSMINWLDTALTKSKTLCASEYDRTTEPGRERKELSQCEYESVINSQLKQIHVHKQTIEHLHGRRDKVIAHADKHYFGDSKKVYKDFPLKDLDISNLMQTICSILKKQFSFLLYVNMTMEVYASSDVSNLLRQVLAARRLWRDGRILSKYKIRVADYFKVDWGEDIEY